MTTLPAEQDNDILAFLRNPALWGETGEKSNWKTSILLAGSIYFYSLVLKLNF